jgi:hypothetical protein
MQACPGHQSGPEPVPAGAAFDVPRPRLNPLVDLQVVELYPYIEYIKYLLSGSIAMSVFIVAMIGGGITFIDDKSRGCTKATWSRRSRKRN